MRVDKYLLNTMNKRNVINIIRTRGPINKAEIARITGLSIPTVMKLTDEFIRGGLVQVAGKGESSGGKRPELLQFVCGAYYIVGVDIGRSKIKAVCMDLAGQIVCKEVMPTGETQPPGALIQRLCTLIEKAIGTSKRPKEKLIGMGIGMPGLLDVERGTVLFSPDFGWENVDLIEPIAQTVVEQKQLLPPGVPILLENANRALAMGENWFGAGINSDYFICINLGHGIGSAIIEEGEFYRGSSGSSGEIGHITLEKEGPACTCGNRGCLEAMASGRAIARLGRQAVQQGRGAAILQKAQNNEAQIDAKAVFDAAKESDEAALSIVNTATEYIGIGVASYINLLDPDKIILAGGMAFAGDILTQGIKQEAKRRQMKFAGRKVKFETAKLGTDATAIGAAALVLKRFIELGGDL